MNTQMRSETPKIYVACLASYNEGNLFGRWIDCAGKSASDIQAEIDLMLQNSPVEDAEEFAIHDHENFLGIELNEYETIENVVKIVECLTLHGKPFAADYLFHLEDKAYLDSGKFQASYLGEFDSEADFVRDKFKKEGRIAELEKNGLPERYIDFDRWADDLFQTDFYSVLDDIHNNTPPTNWKVYVFRK